MRFREKLAQFMYGRRGADELTRLCMFAALVLILLSAVLGGFFRALTLALAVAALVWGYVRIFSRDIAARQRENAWFLEKCAAVRRWFRSLSERWRQRKEYRFFRCPSCRALLRVPKNRGRLLLTCRKCGSRFERRT